jgi:hypothetical protein
MERYTADMERAERPSLAPAASFLAVLAAAYSRFVATFQTDHTPDPTADVAFSDDLERELIQRELHPY